MESLKYLRIILFFLIGFYSLAFAQTDKIMFNHISLEQGLSQTTVFCIYPGSRGFIWIGTESGLNRYDGFDFKVYTHYPFDNQSLSNNTILSIYEDQDGSLWIGTNEGGLNIYDRNTDKFTQYHHDPKDENSLSGSKVFACFRDKNGDMWVGTSAGLDKVIIEEGSGSKSSGRYEGFKFSHYKNDPGNPKSLSHNRVRAILQDSDGTLWFGTQGGGLNKLEKDAGSGEGSEFKRFVHDENDPESISDNDVLYLLQDYAGEIWVATFGGGVNRLIPSAGTFVRYLHDDEDEKSISHNVVLTIHAEKNGTVWFGTYGGGMNKLVRPDMTSLTTANFSFVHYRNDPQDEYSLSNNNVGTITSDKNGILWVGTFGGAINRFDSRSSKFSHYKQSAQNTNSLSAKGVGAIYEDSKGNLWVGTTGGGLNLVDREENKFTHWKSDKNNPSALQHNGISCIIEDNEGTLWIGTSAGGLAKMSDDMKSFKIYMHDPMDTTTLPHNVVRALCIDKDGDLWVGTHGGGLSMMDRQTGKFRHYKQDPDNPHSLYRNRVRAIVVDKEGYLWVGNDALSRFDKRTGEFVHYAHDRDDRNSLSDNSVRSILIDKKGKLWIGTLRGGLNRFDKRSKKFTHWRAIDGLPNDVVYGVLEDAGGYIWVSTVKGISKFDVDANTFKNFDISDGLQSNEFSSGAYFKSKSGEMFLGGINGFNAFYPDSIQSNLTPPDIAITGFQVFNKEVMIDPGGSTPLKKYIIEADSIILSYEEYIFSFDFAALHFSNAKKNQYAYKMVTLDEAESSTRRQGGWQYVGTRRYANFYNLDPGEYIFSVKGANSDGTWNEEGKSIYLTIVPPFWRTQWFYLFWILVGVGGIWLFLKGREKYLHIKLTKLEEEVEYLTDMLEIEKNKNKEDWEKE